MLNKMKIRTKILLSFLIIAIASAGMTIFGILKMKQLDRNSESLYQQVCVAMQNVAVMSTDLQKIKLTFRDMLEENTLDLKNAKAVSIDSLYNEIDTEAKKYEKTLTSAEKADVYTSFTNDFREFRANLEIVDVAIDSGHGSQRLQLDHHIPVAHVPTVQDVIDPLENLQNLHPQKSVCIGDDAESH